MPVCELCNRFNASCILGVDEDLAYRNTETWLRLDRGQVRLACAQCAETLVSRGNAREMPIEDGNAHEIWYSNCLEITDGEESIWARWAPDMLGMA
ncbi:hypothetical protein HUG10_21040 (plasmid) [Halorarum halophilum]|uniref:Uncharacterized protein n=1 Tax=Halorarum halophilum TaxID=2743090 RepID=A0A7D5KAQ7_9EURY|nr:hypothetical protein [Halobaculum halophilum]QLG30074.1 hypothetical protein HUG10_21040 [Halobaculum halophilum]